jgi:hypothetical protein
MAILEQPQHHRYLAAALLRRSIFDLTSQGKHSVDAWHWLLTDPQGAYGWDCEDACRVLELSLPHLRRALLRAGYDRPPIPQIGGQRAKIPGIIPCRHCGEASPAPDMRVQRTCAACGDRIRPKYLRRRGLLSYENGQRCSRRAWARAALQQLLYQGPLPAAYVMRQLMRVGLLPMTIRRARRDLGITRTPAGFQGPWVWALPMVLRRAA